MVELILFFLEPSFITLITFHPCENATQEDPAIKQYNPSSSLLTEGMNNAEPTKYTKLPTNEMKKFKLRFGNMQHIAYFLHLAFC